MGATPCISCAGACAWPARRHAHVSIYTFVRIDNAPSTRTLAPLFFPCVMHDVLAMLARAFRSQGATRAPGRGPRDRIAVVFAVVCTPTPSQTLAQSGHFRPFP